MLPPSFAWAWSRLFLQMDRVEGTIVRPVGGLSLMVERRWEP